MQSMSGSTLRGRNNGKTSRKCAKRQLAVNDAVQLLEKRVLYSAFTPGDLVVYRVGAGSSALSSASTAVFLDEYTPSGTFVQSVALPTAIGSGNNPLTASGTATSEGNLTLSQDGAKLLLTGYDATTGVASIASTNSTTTLAVTNVSSAASTTAISVVSTVGFNTGDAVTLSNLGSVTLSPSQSTYFGYVSSSKVQLYTTAAAATSHSTTGLVSFTGTYSSSAGTTLTDASLTSITQREVGIASPDGTVNTATTLGASLGGNNIRGAASADGTTGVYAGGPLGAVYTTVGSTATAVTSDSTDNIRTLEVYNGQLYGDSGTGTSALLGPIGSGLPTSGTQTITQLPGFVGSGTSGQGLGGAYEFAFANLKGGSTADTLYIADNYNDGVDKYSLVGGNWTLNGEIGAYTGSSSVLNGITGVVAEPTPAGEQLFISSAGSSGTAGTIYSITDPYGYNSVGGSIGTATNGIFSGTPQLTTLVTAGTNKAFRGIEFVPQTAGTLTLTSAPTSQVAAIGGPANFFAAIAPGTNESVQWQINTGSGFVNLSNGTLPDGTVVNGATTDALVLANLPLSESGNTFQTVFTNAHGTLTTTPVALTVNDVPLFNVDASAYTVNENVAAGNLTITVDRAGNTSTSATVNYATADGTATHGVNYTTTTGTLTFASGVTQQTFTVPITNVIPQGGNKFFNVVLSSPSGGGLIGSTSSASVTIVDNQEIFNLSSSTYTVNDTDTTAVVSIVRTGPDTADAGTVPIVVTANGTPYATGSATFAAGQLVAAASFPITAGTSNQALNVSFGTLSAFSGFTGTPQIGISASATETVVHVVNNTGTTNNVSTSVITSSALSVTDIETSGPYSQNFGPVVGDVAAGTGSFGYLAYEVLEFSPTTTPSLYPVVGTTVNTNGLSNLSLQLFNADAGTDNYGGHIGNFNVYFFPDSTTTTPTSGLKFITTASQLPSGLPITKAGTSGDFTITPVLLGTFSFNNTAGYDTYTPAAIPTAVETALVTDLNSGTDFRLAVTPQTNGKGAIAADFRGLFAGQTPQLSFLSTETVNQSTETVIFQNPSITVSESAGLATITLTRSGTTIADTETVNYSTSDGSAIAGINYTATSGTATFAAGSSTTSFTVPVSNVVPQNGDKLFYVTLSSPMTGTPATTVGVVGKPSTAMVTITDTAPTLTETLTPTLVNAADVEVGGPYSPTTGLEIKADDVSASGNYPSFGAIDFSSSPMNTVTAIDNITLTLTNEPGSVAAGPINFYLVSDTTSNITASSPQSANPHFFDSSVAPEGVGAQFGTKYLLGTYNLTDTAAGDTLNIPLTGYSPAAAAALVSELNSGEIRIVMTAENTSVSANFVGISAGITIKAQESLSLPAWVAPGSVATWDGTNLYVTGPTTIIGDPQAYSNSPIITAAGTPAVLTIAPTSTNAVHIASLNLSNGAVASLPASTTSPVILLVTSSNGLTIGSTSKLDLGDGYLDVANGNIGTINSELASGYNNGQWNGLTGITSTAAHNNGAHLTALGGVVNNSAYSTFDGATVGSNDVLVRYTYYGDANVSGQVDGSDYTRIDNGYLNHLSGWMNGDFNYDGVIDGSDYTLIDNAFNTQGAASPQALIASVSKSVVHNTEVVTNPALITDSSSLFSKKKVKASLISELENLITHA